MENSQEEKQVPLRRVRKYRAHWSVMFYRTLFAMFGIVVVVLLLLGWVRYS
jgi:cell division septal protein FtsQ